MRRGQDVRKQLVTIMDRYKMDIVAAGKNYNKVHRRARSRSWLAIDRVHLNSESSRRLA